MAVDGRVHGVAGWLLRVITEFQKAYARGCTAAHRGTPNCQNPDRTPEAPFTTQIWTDPFTHTQIW